MTVLLIIASILTIIFIFAAGFNLWFWIVLVFWIVFFALFSNLFNKAGIAMTLVVFVIISIFSIYFISNGSNILSNSSNKKLSAKECKPLIEKYNNKQLNISGENATGLIGITIDDQCRYSARYILTFNADLPENPNPELFGSPIYNYVNNLHNPSETDRGHYGVGALSPVYQNQMSLPDVFADSVQISDFYSLPSQSSDTPTNSFYWTYEKSGNFNQDRYESLFDDTVFEVIDGLPFMVKESMGDNAYNYSIDHDRAEVEGNIVKTIELSISEQ